MYTDAAVLRDLPPRARWYTVGVIVAGAVTFAALVPRATLTPVPTLLLFIVLSSLTSTFKVHFPIASGSNMSVSYIVDIAALILRGPHAGMIVAAASGLTQSTLNQPTASRNPLYRTLFNVSILVITAQASGQVYGWLGGTSSTVDLVAAAWPLSGMALTYFVVNTAMRSWVMTSPRCTRPSRSIGGWLTGLTSTAFRAAATHLLRGSILGVHTSASAPAAFAAAGFLARLIGSPQPL